MEGFERLLQRKHQNIKKSEFFRRQLYQKTLFNAWRAFAMPQVEQKLTLAENLYHKIVKRNAIMA